MFYKGYRYHIIVALIVALFVTGFIVQIKNIKTRLYEFEKLNKFLYSHLLDQQFSDIEYSGNSEGLTTISKKKLYQTIDSIVISQFMYFFPPEEIIFILTDQRDSILHSNNLFYKQPNNYKVSNKDFLNVATIQISENDKLFIKVPDVIKKQNRLILILFVTLCVMFCFVTLGVIIFIFEREKKLQKIRLDVINNMTHEFKTPLTSIKLISEMIMQQGSSLNEEKLTQYAKIIHQETNKLLRQARQVLNSAYYEDNKFVLRKRAFNIHGLIDFIVSSHSVVYSEDEIRISKNLKATDPMVITDRNHFVNVITNLLVNARKYAKKNQVDVCISTYNEHNKLFIEVSDNGTGIDPKYQSLIFDRFYRVPSGNIHERSGYGIGLFYVKNVLRQMNADIKIRSRPGQGSTFIIQMKNFKKTYT